MYKVIHSFFDIEDKTKHVYEIGDKFPFDDRKISKKRIEELSSNKNKIGEVLIDLDSDNYDNFNDDTNLNDNLNNSNKDNLNSNE